MSGLVAGNIKEYYMKSPNIHSGRLDFLCILAVWLQDLGEVELLHHDHNREQLDPWIALYGHTSPSSFGHHNQQQS